jgi:hypothetical protein
MIMIASTIVSIRIAAAAAVCGIDVIIRGKENRG